MISHCDSYYSYYENALQQLLLLIFYFSVSAQTCNPYKDYSLTVLPSFIYTSSCISQSENLFHVTSNVLTCINSLSLSLLFTYGI